MKKHSLISLAGIVWFSMGLALLIKGLKLIILSAHFGPHKGGPIISVLMYAFTGAVIPATLVLIFLGLILGFAKGKWALRKIAKKTVKRIYPMEGPIRLYKLYRIHDFLLIGGMIALSRLMNWSFFPEDIHGIFDVAIGSALVNGSMVYFHYAIKIKEESDKIAS